MQNEVVSDNPPLVALYDRLLGINHRITDNADRLERHSENLFGPIPTGSTADRDTAGGGQIGAIFALIDQIENSCGRLTYAVDNNTSLVPLASRPEEAQERVRFDVAHDAPRNAGSPSR